MNVAQTKPKFGTLTLCVLLLAARDIAARAEATMTTLVTFNGTNGSLPMAGLTLATDGNFYGTTYEGGENGSGIGTAFKMTPAGQFTSLASFTSGSNPGGELLEAKDGNFYGATLAGGELGGGTVFKMTRSGEITTLYSFGDYDKNGGENTNGHTPAGGLVQSKNGNLYGITCGYGFGDGWTVFQISPRGELKTLIAFRGREGPSQCHR